MKVRRIPSGHRRLVSVPVHDRRIEDIVAALTPFCNRRDSYERERAARCYLDSDGNIAVLVDTYGS